MKSLVPVLLSIENSSNLCSISISNGKYFYYKEILNKNISSNFILSLIDDLFVESEFLPEKINAISISNGPGNFTNLKVMSSIVQSISSFFKIPIISVGSLSVIALEASYNYKAKYIFVTTDAKTNCIYYNIYENINLNIRPLFLKITCGINDFKKIKLKFNNIIGILNISDEYINIFRLNNYFLDIKKNIYPKAIYVDLLVRKNFFMSKIILPSEIFPIYLKKM